MKIIKSKAFSLIEVSIVILIVGFIIAAITQSSRLLKSTRISAARTFTANSAISSDKDLAAWLETTNKDSLDQMLDDGSAISSWKDNNSAIMTATQASATLQPTLKSIGISGLPVIKFDGVDDYMASPEVVVKNNFTVFLVAQTSVTHEVDAEGNSGANGISGQKYILFPVHGGLFNSDNSKAAGGGVSIGTNGISIYEHSGGYLPPTAVYDGNVGTNPVIVAWVVDNKQHKIYLNGVLVRTGVAGGSRDIYASNRYGGDAYGYFSGLLGEYILIGRKMNDSERKEIEKYLSKKWKIAVTG